MPHISDGEIRSALRRVERTRKQETLVDGEGHGTGRLILAVPGDEQELLKKHGII